MSLRPPVEDALKLLKPRWSEARAIAAAHGMERKRRRRRTARAAFVLAAVMLCTLGAWRLAPLRASAPAVLPNEVVAPPSLAVAFSVEAEGPAAQAVYADGSLVRGRVRAKGTGLVRAGQLEISVLQGRVLVDRADGVVRVWVEEGEAVVRGDGAERRLTAGQSGEFPAEPEAEVETVPVAPVTPLPRPGPAKRAAWKQLAEQGDFDAAWASLRREKQPLRDEPAELLLAADVARLSRHPEEALAPLERVVARHPKDPRAALAAFTLGRTLLDELGRPADAATAFGAARKLAPKGPLADDALAREVEAQARAGHAPEARRLADEYLRSLPQGPRARLVRHFGGLE